MSLRRLEFLLQETFTGIRRNAYMSVAAVSTMAVFLMLLGGLRLFTANVGQLAESLGSRFEMRVFLDVDASPSQRDALGKRISGLSGVGDCRLVPREEAWPELRKRLEGKVNLGDLGGPEWLPDAFVVRVEDLGQMGAVADRIRAMPHVDEVVDTRDAAERLDALAGAVQIGGLLAVGLLAMAGAVIVSNTIRLTVHARRLEIGIMQLVGATNGCVRAPFLLEGAVHGMTGALLAVGLLTALYAYVHDRIQQTLPFLEVLPPTGGLFWSQVGLLLAVGVVLGLTGSYFSVRKYLRT